MSIISKRRKRTIVIVGARMDGHAGVILDSLQLIGGYKVTGFIDNSRKIQNSLINCIPVLGSTDDLG